MGFYHVSRVFAALMIGAMLTAPSYGQTRAEEQSSDKLKLSKAEMTQYKALTGLVDAVASGKEPAPGDFTVAFHHHFIRSTSNVFVPYVLEIGPGKPSSFPVAVYVRAQRKGAANASSEPAFADIYFPNASGFTSTGQDSVQFSRAMELPPGDFEVTFAMSESPSKNTRTPPKRVVHTQALTVPDFSGALTTSSIVLARDLEAAPQQLTPRQQMEQPFTIGGQKITPALTPTFTKSAELLFMFLVYNEGATPAGKPDIEVGYTLTRGAEAKPFAKMPNTLFNETTLPAEFNLSAGHQVLVVQGVPLASLAPGDYKLAIAITDKTNNGAITRTVPFTVIP
jgi:hypothetical protein